MAYEDNITRITKLLREFGPLTKEEIKSYFYRLNSTEPGSIEALIRSMASRAQLYVDNELVRSYPNEKLDKKTLVAFWILSAFADKAEDRYFKTKYPSQIGFTTETGVFLITVCDDKYRDKELISLREKKPEDVNHIIVGINLDVEDINKEILPEGNFVYARFDTANLISGTPKIHFRKVS